mmetsp:Transcript_9482/g.10416  ORF Transcript_9482/g.10416 Transcript_9482/m.10416 type:complete len:313 (+) Transcript_9482:113-1051(+)
MLLNIDPNRDGTPKFEEFLLLLCKVEGKLKDEESEENDVMVGISDTKILDFLRLLEEYRQKCEDEGNYKEAKKAAIKYEELRRKETLRQRTNIKMAQEEELKSIEDAQRNQFVEFSNAWDKFMSDYEATAYMSLEKLKEKHLREYQEFREQSERKLRAKMKYSKELLELRRKQKVLAKLRQYEDADKVKAQGDALEEWERAKHEAEIQDTLQKKETKLRQQQQMALSALLKRIQRDRNEQLKHRQMDSQRLIQRNKNLLNDLATKQNHEAKKTVTTIRQTLGMTAVDNIYVPEKKEPTSLESYKKKRKPKAK